MNFQHITTTRVLHTMLSTLQLIQKIKFLWLVKLQKRTVQLLNTSQFEQRTNILIPKFVETEAQVTLWAIAVLFVPHELPSTTTISKSQSDKHTETMDVIRNTLEEDAKGEIFTWAHMENILLLENTGMCLMIMSARAFL